MKHEIEQDIWQWITEYIEVNHEFYDYKFPPCPYARGARLKGALDVVAWTAGNTRTFIDAQTHDLLQSHKTVRVLVFPPSLRWNWLTRWHIANLNKTLVPQDYYIQYGGAVETQSRYPGWPGEYVIVIINLISDVLQGHEALKSTAYYRNWSNAHYHNVVQRRQRVYNRYKDTK